MIEQEYRFLYFCLILRDIYIFHLLVAVPHVPKRKTATFLVSARAEISHEFILLSYIGVKGCTAARFLIATFNETKSFRFGYNRYEIFPFRINARRNLFDSAKAK